MNIKPQKGMQEYLPEAAAQRDRLMNLILETYTASGFTRIYTPAIESAENLDKSDGGDNLNLIFRIMKRGDKLAEALAKNPVDEKELCDLGLRYDLTLPLSRYYANNRNSLPSPFKCIQIDKVYRAERPQRGRLREFVQCDIDILGSDSWCCEIELISVTAKALSKIGIGEFTVRVNDRRVLRNSLLTMGFPEDSLDTVSVSFDKLDKIGADGVAAELREKGMPEEAVNSLSGLLAKGKLTLDDMAQYCSEDAKETLEQLRTIIETADKLSDSYTVEFDPSLVRGQGYYTGTVFEVASKQFGGTIAGATITSLADSPGTLFLRSASPSASSVFSPSLPRTISSLQAAAGKWLFCTARRRSWKLSRNPTSSRLRATLRSSPQPTARRLTRLTQRQSSRDSTRSSR